MQCVGIRQSSHPSTKNRTASTKLHKVLLSGRWGWSPEKCCMLDVSVCVLQKLTSTWQEKIKGTSRGIEALQSHMNDSYYKSVSRHNMLRGQGGYKIQMELAPRTPGCPLNIAHYPDSHCRCLFSKKSILSTYTTNMGGPSPVQDAHIKS